MLKKLLIISAIIFSAGTGIGSVSAYRETGSIAVSLEEGVKGTSVKDVEFELIQVGNIVDGVYEYTEDFSDEKTDLNKIETSDELGKLAVKLDSYADKNDIKGDFLKTDSKGYLKFSDLEVGIYLLRVSNYAKYEYVEATLITVPTYNEDVQNSMNFDITVIPKHTPFKVSVSKQDITDHKELEGAHLQITDEKGNIVDEWVSEKEPYMIQNLYCGETYKLTETIAPKNYKVAQSINFKVEESGKIQKVVMYDELLPVKVKTGDNTNIAVYCIIGGLSLILIGFAMFNKRKKEN